VSRSFDAAGRRISEATNGASLLFRRDADGIYHTLRWPDGAQLTYAYDAADRFSSVSASVTRGAVTTSVAYDEADRLLSESGPVSMALSYDPTGRLQKSVINGTTTTFLWDGPALVAEYTGSGAVLRRYAHGPATDNPLIEFDGTAVSTSNASYLLEDRQGSILAQVNGSGQVTTQQTYDPYGVPNQ
jgi:YD repeat-containing protein